jgi:electron transfer flavoprotein beta subunit
VKIGVCLKVTPDTDTRIKIKGDGEGIDPTGIKWIVSPYDMNAIEEGIQTKEKHGGEVIVFSVGDDSTITQLRGGGLALGAERAVLVNDPAVLASDSLGVAKALAAALKNEDIQLVFCGKQGADNDNVQVPAMLSECLGWPQVSFVTEFSTDGTTFQATREVGGGKAEVCTGNLPVVITCDRGLNTPRYAKLPAIMKAKRKKIAKPSLADLGLSADDVAPAVEFSAYGLPPARPAGRILEGEVDDQVKELVSLLRNEAKVV